MSKGSFQARIWSHSMRHRLMNFQVSKKAKELLQLRFFQLSFVILQSQQIKLQKTHKGIFNFIGTLMCMCKVWLSLPQKPINIPLGFTIATVCEEYFPINRAVIAVCARKSAGYLSLNVVINYCLTHLSNLTQSAVLQAEITLHWLQMTVFVLTQ